MLKFTFCFVVCGLMLTGSLCAESQPGKNLTLEELEKFILEEDGREDGDFSVAHQSSRTQIVVSMGPHTTLGRAAFGFGGRAGFAISDNSEVFVGPSIHLGFSSNRFLLGILGGVWSDIPVYRSQQILIGGGLHGGYITLNDPSASNGLGFLLELSVSQQLSAETRLRGSILPGYAGGQLCFWLMIGLQFAA